jgi:ATP-dependent RNA helicase DDX35
MVPIGQFPSFFSPPTTVVKMSDLDIGGSFIPALYRPTALLPIAEHKNALLYLVEKFPVTIVVGETGSGKTTQIPQYLAAAGGYTDGKQIAITQVGSL